jgi:gamma type small acid-soluble spore protein
MNNNGKSFSQSGTDINEVKRQNAQAGNGQGFSTPSAGVTPAGTDIQKVREEIAAESAPFAQPAPASQSSQPFTGKTASGTNIQKVREEIAAESAPFAQPFSQPSMGKTVAGTDIQEVKRQNQQAEQGKQK